MRSVRSLLCLLVGVVAFTGCDSEQPAQVLTSIASIEMSATNSVVKAMHTWNVFEDNDNNNVPDDGQTYLWCEFPASGTSQTSVPTSVPWSFSTEVSIIRAGTTVREVITSENATAKNFNIAQYDRTSVTNSVTPTKPPQIVNGRLFKFTMPRRHPSVRYELMNAVKSPLANLTGATFGNGVCSAGTPGEARLDSVPLPYMIELNKGDTIIVKARINNEVLPMSGLAATVNQFPQSLSGRLQIDGRTVNVLGSRSGPAVSFSFTVK